jgi:hypothetical protein
MTRDTDNLPDGLKVMLGQPYHIIFNVFKQIQVQGEKQVHTPMDIEYVRSKQVFRPTTGAVKII